MLTQTLSQTSTVATTRRIIGTTVGLGDLVNVFDLPGLEIANGNGVQSAGQDYTSLQKPATTQGNTRDPLQSAAGQVSSCAFLVF